MERLLSSQPDVKLLQKSLAGKGERNRSTTSKSKIDTKARTGNDDDEFGNVLEHGK